MHTFIWNTCSFAKSQFDFFTNRPDKLLAFIRCYKRPCINDRWLMIEAQYPERTTSTLCLRNGIFSSCCCCCCFFQRPKLFRRYLKLMQIPPTMTQTSPKWTDVFQRCRKMTRRLTKITENHPKCSWDNWWESEAKVSRREKNIHYCDKFCTQFNPPQTFIFAVK